MRTGKDATSRTSCIEKFDPSEMKKMRRLFSKEEDKKLISLVDQYGENNWNSIAKHMSGRTVRQLKDRYLKCLSPKIKREPWTEEEDSILLNKFLEIGPHWLLIGSLMNRSDNDCKIRFYYHVSQKMNNKEKDIPENECSKDDVSNDSLDHPDLHISDMVYSLFSTETKDFDLFKEDSEFYSVVDELLL